MTGTIFFKSKHDLFSSGILRFRVDIWHTFSIDNYHIYARGQVHVSVIGLDSLSVGAMKYTHWNDDQDR